jgi:hypothetical protein
MEASDKTLKSLSIVERKNLKVFKFFLSVIPSFKHIIQNNYYNYENRNNYSNYRSNC